METDEIEIEIEIEFIGLRHSRHIYIAALYELCAAAITSAT